MLPLAHGEGGEGERGRILRAMAQQTQQLLDLQRLDAEIGRLTRQIQQTEAGLADRLQERAAALATRQAEETARAQQREQRDLEYELATLETRIKEHEQRLYGGKGSPRDLQALQRDIEHDQQRRGDLETKVLLAMEATEKANQELARVKATAGRLLEEMAARQRQLEEELNQLRSSLGRTEDRRAEAAGAIGAPVLALYQRLRQRMPDQLAVAEVLQGRCEGCRTTLPSAEIQRARRSETPVQCSACGRILHVPHG